MNAKLRLIKSIATLTFVSIFLVVALLVSNGAFAWFAKSTEVSANNMAVAVECDDVIESIKYYRVTNTLITTDSNGIKHNKYQFGFSESVLQDQYIYGTTQQERTSFDTAIVCIHTRNC